MSATYLPIEIYVHGVDEVNDVFKTVADNAEKMGERFKDTSHDLLVLTMGARGVIGLAEAFGMLNDEQSKNLRLMFQMIDVFGATLRVIDLLSTAEWALTAAKKARTIASAIASAVESWGLSVPILAAAAIAGGVAITAALAAVPTHHYEGVIPQTGPYIMARGQHVTAPGAGGGMTVNIYYPSFTDRGDMDYFVDMLKRMGQA